MAMNKHIVKHIDAIIIDAHQMRIPKHIVMA